VGWVEILVKSFDGERWSENFMVNAPVEPYNISKGAPTSSPSRPVHDGRLYVVWERNVQYPEEGVPQFYSDIWMRSTDGESWDGPRKVSMRRTGTTTRARPSPPSAEALCGLEEVDFRNPAQWSWRMLARSFDGTALGPVTEVASAQTRA